MNALKDFVGATRNLRAWSYLAGKQIQLEYRRTVLGNAWIVIAFVVPAAGIGWLTGTIQQRDLMVHIPYVAFGFVAWNFIAGLITEACFAFTRNRSMLLQSRIDRFVFIFSLTLRKLFLLMIHLVTACLVAILATMSWTPEIHFQWLPTWHMIWLPLSLSLFVLTAFGVGALLAALGTVMRDFAELVASIMRLAFFFTPIIWTFERRFGGGSEALRILATYNPFSYYIELIRSPAMGYSPEPLTWIVVSGLTVVSLMLGLLAIQVFGRRLVFWL
ncbi:ABC transporter permease [Maricaulis sp.]|uniref:ABC transporter permease n=1 Tax=Maricaulis sp. TaxID=1486257 RepID=UPI0025C0EB45|nr:ABC transporter permease [Maricaulis sp.]